MYRGTVKTLTQKGFGFIKMGEGQRDLFFHARSLEGVRFEDLNVGDELEFEMAQGEKGPNATNVRRAPDA